MAKRNIDASKYPEKGWYETRYFRNANEKNPKRAMGRGFPWSEEGSIEGAMKAAGKGLVSKVENISRETGLTRWTVRRGDKIRGTKIYEVSVIKGKDEK